MPDEQMYVGRIVVVGKTTQPFVAYRVSSRSFPNRVARVTGDGVAVQPLDAEEVKRNPYIAYNCIRMSRHGVVVSNGTHTDPLTELLDRGVDPQHALRQVLTEMDTSGMISTPRVLPASSPSIPATWASRAWMPLRSLRSPCSSNTAG